MKTKKKEKKPPLKTGERMDLLAIEIILKKIYLTEIEVAFITGLSIFTLRNDRFLCKGIPYLRVGARKIMYRMVDVIQYMERRRITF